MIRLVKATEILNNDFSKPLSRKSLKFVATQDSHEIQVLYAASKTNISISRKLRKRRNGNGVTSPLYFLFKNCNPYPMRSYILTPYFILGIFVFHVFVSEKPGRHVDVI